MATGFVQRFQGKIKAGELWIGTKGGVYDASSGIRTGGASGVALLAMPVTATANTDFTFSIPPTAVVTSLTVYTTTAYTGATVTIQLGSSAGDSSYVAATTIKAAGVYVLTMATTAAAAMLSAPTGSPNMFVRVVQTATTTAVGAGTLVVEYTLP